MTTVGNLIDDVLDELLGSNTEQVTTIAGAMSSTELAPTVTGIRAGALGAATGEAELEQERIYIADLAADGTLTIPPWGRGWRGTTAVAHPAGTVLTTAPRYPRNRVLRALNDSLSRVFPAVFAVRVQNFTTTTASHTYNLDDTAQFVINAQWQSADWQQDWVGVRQMRTSTSRGSAEATGITLDVADWMEPGRPLAVTYGGLPAPFVAEGDLFSATGLPASMTDVVVTGAVATLLPASESSRSQLLSMEQQNRSGLVAAGASTTNARYLEQRFATRLAEERRKQGVLYPPRYVGSWL